MDNKNPEPTAPFSCNEPPGSDVLDKSPPGERKNFPEPTEPPPGKPPGNGDEGDEGDDPDDLEDEIDEAEDDGDVETRHTRKTTGKKHGKAKR